MPVVIGTKAESSFADPIGLMKGLPPPDRAVLVGAVQVSGQASLMADLRADLETALRYFREVASKLTADEEESLFPKLRSMERPEVKAVLAKMAALEDDHAGPARSTRRSNRLGQKCLASGRLSADESQRFSIS
jgi:hypothetical protein